MVADSVYGSSPDFVGAIELRVGLTYFVRVPGDALCRIQRPSVREKTCKNNGRVKTKRRVSPEEKKPVAAARFAKNLNDVFWYRRRVSTEPVALSDTSSQKGRSPLSGRSARKNRLDDLKRAIEATPSYSFFISNAPLNTA